MNIIGNVNLDKIISFVRSKKNSKNRTEKETNRTIPANTVMSYLDANSLSAKVQAMKNMSGVSVIGDETEKGPRKLTFKDGKLVESVYFENGKEIRKTFEEENFEYHKRDFEKARLCDEPLNLTHKKISKYVDGKKDSVTHFYNYGDSLEFIRYDGSEENVQKMVSMHKNNFSQPRISILELKDGELELKQYRQSSEGEYVCVDIEPMDNAKSEKEFGLTTQEYINNFAEGTRKDISWLISDSLDTSILKDNKYCEPIIISFDDFVKMMI